MSRRVLTERISYFLVIAIAFAMPLHSRIVPVLIILLALCWIIEGRFHEKLALAGKHSVALLPALLYLLYLVGMLYSSNQSFGWRDLETKLSMLLFPLLLVSTATYPPARLRNIIKWFIAGCLLGAVICLACAIYSFFLERYQVEQGIVHDTYINTDFFFGSRLSVFLHPSYFAMYLCFAMVLLARELLLNKLANGKWKALILFIILFFSAMIFLLASKLGMILLVLIWLCAAGWIIVKRKKVIAGFVAIVLFAAGFAMLYKFSAIVASRIDYTIAALTVQEVDKTSTESSTVRRLIWQQAWDIIEDHPLGAGTGDSKDVLMKKYSEEGLTGAYAKNLNAHNQYLQTAVAIGWPGLIVLVASLAGVMIRALKYRDTASWALVLMLVISFLTESMLETQAGVVFYSFFLVLAAYTSGNMHNVEQV